MTPEMCCPEGGIIRTRTFNITDHSAGRHPGLTGKDPAHLVLLIFREVMPAFLQGHMIGEIHESPALPVHRYTVPRHFAEGFPHPVVCFQLADKKLRVTS